MSRFLRATARRCCGGSRTAVEVFSLVTGLAAMTALPIIQLIAFGYLLDVAGRLARGRSLRDALDWLRPAGDLGLAVVALMLLSLPIGLLSHWAQVAELVSPGTPQADALRAVGAALVAAAVLYLGWAWARGGRLRHYLWPQPLRLLSSGWRPSTWFAAADALGRWIAAWRLGSRFWLGLRGALGTLLWLMPASVIIVASRRGETGLAGCCRRESLVGWRCAGRGGMPNPSGF